MKVDAAIQESMDADQMKVIVPETFSISDEIELDEE